MLRKFSQTSKTQHLSNKSLINAELQEIIEKIGLTSSDFDIEEVSRRQISRRLIRTEYHNFQKIQHWEITYEIKFQKRINNSGKLKFLSKLLSLAHNTLQNKQEERPKSIANSTTRQRKLAVYQALRKHFSYQATIGIMGNIEVQSGSTYDPHLKQRGPYDKETKRYKEGPGYGIFQFDYHKKNYFNYINKNSKEDTIESQVSYMVSTIFGQQRDFIGRGNANRIKKMLQDPTLSAKQIAKNFCLQWERPKEGSEHLDRRINACESLAKEFKK